MEARPPSLDEEPTLQTVLSAIEDEDCRRILGILSEPMSAQEIGATCEIPLSTVYRKLDLLSEAGLVSDRLDVSDPGRQTRRYEPDFSTVTVELNDDGTLDVQVSSERSDDSVLPSEGISISPRS
ncbi:MAG: helix-turn-helix domain-containing protein [Halanaeroarchaeum sp.]